MAHVAGCTVANDVSARDLQLHKNGGQWLLGKTLDSYCPLGPALVTIAAISGDWAAIFSNAQMEKRAVPP